MRTTDENNEITRGGRVERYALVDGYLECFVGYVHRAESPLELAYRELCEVERGAGPRAWSAL
jgi:hypothetical protein